MESEKSIPYIETCDIKRKFLYGNEISIFYCVFTLKDEQDTYIMGIDQYENDWRPDWIFSYNHEKRKEPPIETIVKWQDYIFEQLYRIITSSVPSIRLRALTNQQNKKFFGDIDVEKETYPKPEKVTFIEEKKTE